MNKTSISEILPYFDFCNKVASDETGSLIKNFRRHPDYDQVIPGTRDKDEVIEFVELIENEYAEMLKFMPLFEKNQGFGNPVIHKYDIGSFDVNMVLQIYYLAIIRRRFGDLSGMRICEIGAGAGLLFKLITDLYPNVYYTFVDLPGPLHILKKYVEHLGRERNVIEYLPCSTVMNQAFPTVGYDLVTSDCAFNELDSETQLAYIRIILNMSIRGRISCYNSTFNENGVTPMSTIDLFCKIDRGDKAILMDLRVPTIYWGI